MAMVTVERTLIITLVLYSSLIVNAIAETLPFTEINPHNVEVTEVHAVFSSHFDGGCKTPGCGRRVQGEPDRCATVGAGNRPPSNTGEPWAYHIVNRYFDEYIADAVNYTNSSNNDIDYKYLIQPWVVALFFDCENSGMVSWPGSGFALAGVPVLHCPEQSAIDALKHAMRSGNVFMHAFPHDGEASYYPDTSLFETALKVSFDIADSLQIARPIAVSQRDVPGWTRATLPILNANGIVGLSFGAGTPPGKPDTPPLFVWRDEASGAEVVTTYETAYGTANTVFVLPNGVAFAACWYGDNKGVPSIEFAKQSIVTIMKKYPNATVKPSTLDVFFSIANEPSVKAQLPVVTSEIGDGWIYGVPSDPLKNSLFREASRLRKECVATKQCDPEHPALKAYDRLLVKVPEHTWGVAQGWFLPDYTNWSNPLFDKARAQQKDGFVSNNSVHADYNTTVNSWLEQRTFVTAGPAMLQKQYPLFARHLEESLNNLSAPQLPSVVGFEQRPLSTTFGCGSLTLKFGADGGLITLKNNSNDVTWASESNRIGVYRYQTFTDDDYAKFLGDFAIRTGGCSYQPNSTTDETCSNFRKPGLSLAKPKHRDITGTLTAVYQQQHHHQKQEQGQHHHQQEGRCVFITNISFIIEAVETAGAPSHVLTTIVVSNDDNIITWDVVAVNKRPTRLPEAMFFTFNPLAKVDNWTLQVLGSTMDPRDTFGGHGNASSYGGSPHLKGVESVHGVAQTDGAAFEIESLDVPIIAVGDATPFPTPRNQAPNMSYGVSYNIFQNIWNTNYVLWYPFVEDDANIRSRFQMSFH